MSSSSSSVASKRQLASRLRDLSNQQKSEPIIDEDSLYQSNTDQLAINWRTESEKGRFDEDEDILVYVSSATRNAAIHPSPAQYTIPLAIEANNVIKASIIQASFPLTDTLIHSSNNILRFSFSPYTAIKVATIPTGNYTGESLAIEIMCRMHSVVFSAPLLAGTYRIDAATGFVVHAAGSMPNETQFLVTFDPNRSQFRFQVVDKDMHMLNTNFALHVQPLPIGNFPGTHRGVNDDIFDVLGINRLLTRKIGTLDTQGNYYITNTADTAQSSGNNQDTRYAYSTFSNESADLRGNCAIVIDIPQLNENDLNWSVNQQSEYTKFSVNSCMGLIYTRDAAHIKDRMVEFSSSSYPIQKFYRLGRSRINALSIHIRRLDGSTMDFDNKDHFFTVKLTTKKSQPAKAIFAR